jgi:hypothetical protein
MKQPTKQQNYLKKLVSSARAIITNQVALPLGIHKMLKIVFWINQIEPLTIDLIQVNEYYRQIMNYPLGSDRLLWNRTKLIQLDAELEEVTRHYRHELLLKCFEIIDLYPEMTTEELIID